MKSLKLNSVMNLFFTSSIIMTSALFHSVSFAGGGLIVNTQNVGNQTNISRIELPTDGWVKYTCLGNINVATASVPNLVPLTVAHFPVAATDKYPTSVELQKKYPDKFTAIDKMCNESRLAKTCWTGPNHWGQDSGYQHVQISEVQYPLNNIVGGTNACRPANEACRTNADCCGGSTCNTTLNTCIANPSTNTSAGPSCALTQ